MMLRGRLTYITFLIYGLVALIATILGYFRLSPLGIGLMILAIVVAGLVYYLDLHRPAHIAKAVKIDVIQTQTSFLLKLMCVYMQNEFNIQNLRCSIMLARRKFLRGWKPLKIDFCIIDDYGDVELQQSYGYDIGCCGTALAEKEQVYFDSDTAQEPYKGMTATQRMATSQIKSILSTPVIRPGDVHLRTPIAILNMDSNDQLQETNFDKSNVQEAARKFANFVASLII